MRHFIRHPSDIPIEFQVEEGAPSRNPMRNISQGGLSFHSPRPLPDGATIRLVIPVSSPPFATSATVVWSKASGTGFEIGVRFDDASTEFAVRMVEQICHIEQYRREMRTRQGRELSSEEAAREWIKKYARHFPR